MQVGISQLVVSELPMEKFFEQAAQADYDVVELAMRTSGPLTADTPDAQLQDIVEISAEHGLPIVSVTLTHLTGNLLDSGRGQQTGIEETVAGLRAAKRLGAGCTLHTLGRLSPDLYYDDAYHNGISALKKIAPTCEELGIKIAVEFVWNGFLFSPLEMKRFLDEVGCDHIGFYFDPGNMAVFQYPHHWVRILGKHIKMVHLKDWKGGPLNGGWPALLEGEIDYAAMNRELRAIGYDGPLISEVSPSDASLEATAQAIRKIWMM